MTHKPRCINRVSSKRMSTYILQQWAAAHHTQRFQFIYGPSGTIVADGELAVLLIDQPDKMKNWRVFDVRGKSVDEVLI